MVSEGGKEQRRKGAHECGGSDGEHGGKVTKCEQEAGFNCAEWEDDCDVRTAA